MWPFGIKYPGFFIGCLFFVSIVFSGIFSGGAVLAGKSESSPKAASEAAMDEMEDNAMRSVNVQHLIVRHTDSEPRQMDESWQLLSEKSMAAITGAGSDFEELFRPVEPELVEDEKWDANQAPVQFRATVNDLHGELLALVEDEWTVLERFKVPRSYFGYMGFEKYGWELEYEDPVKETIETDIRFRYRTGVDGRPVKLAFLIDQYSEDLRRDPPLVDYEIHFEGGKLLIRGRTWNIRSGQFAIWQYAD